MLHRSACHVLVAITMVYASVAWAQTQVDPRFLVIVDTSGSMLWTPQQTSGYPEGVYTHGDGSAEHAGCDYNGDGLFNDSKIYGAKTALYNVVSAYGEVEFALERFHQTEYGASCTSDPDPGNFIYCIPDPTGQRHAMYCPAFCGSNGTDYVQCTGDPCTGADPVEPTCAGHTSPIDGVSPITCSNPTNSRFTFQSCIYYQGTCSGGDLLVPFPTTQNNTQAVLSWVDGHEYDFFGGTDKELRPWGSTPLAGSLQTARTYLTGTVLPADQTKRTCRSYNVILMTDGMETCSGSPAALAGELYSSLYCSGASCCVGCGTGDHIPVKVWAVGFAICPGGGTSCQAATDLNNIAAQGGTGSAYFVTNQVQLEAALAEIIASSIPVEQCNGVDDNCNDLIDEDWPEKGSACTVGVGECRRAGDYICKPDGSGTCCGTGDPDGGGTCLSPGTPGTEICDGLDNDCNGFIDDNVPGGCASCVPTGPEVCDGKDNDCNGVADDGDMPGVGVDCGLNVGECRPGTTACVGGKIECQGGTPPAAEICDGKDNDCDGVIDGLSQPCYPLGVIGCSDATGSWVCDGICQVGQQICNAGPAWGPCLGAVTPQTELPCDGVDNDCDGQTDEGFGIGDPCGVGECQGHKVCLGGAVVCDGAGPTAEVCDGLDNDCNGTIDDVPGLGSPCGTGECRGVMVCQGNDFVCDGPPPTNEICDGLDNDCDGTIDDDVPGAGDPCGTGVCAGTMACVGGTMVCNGAPPQPEECDGVDNDCNGTVDDVPGLGLPCGYGQCEGVWVCDGTTVFCNGAGPATEICDGVDNDCDGATDEEDPLLGEHCYTLGTGCDAASGTCDGECRLGTWVCQNGGLVCVDQAGPLPEKCDGLDNDCDGDTDEDFPLLGQACDNGMLGLCLHDGTYVCKPDGSGVICNAPPGVPSEEVCDEYDNDCDGETNESPLTGEGAPCSSNVGECQAGVRVCRNFHWECDGGKGPTDEVCNGLDDNCNGEADDHPTIDEGGACFAAEDGTAYEYGCDVGTGVCLGECRLGHEVCEEAALVCRDAVGPLDVELCNLKDDDCDGLIDNNAICPDPEDFCYEGECVERCVDNELGGCDGVVTTCVHLAEGQAPTPCWDTPTEPDCYCIPSMCADVTCPAGFGCDPLTGECLDPCAGVNCSSWEKCVNGRCLDCNSLPTLCQEGQKCVGHDCVEDKCWKVECPEGQYCDPENGKCRPPCKPSDCGYCEKCSEDGKSCVADPCCEVHCPAGQYCNPENGECRGDPCATVNCAAGFVCSKADGECYADPCAALTCGTCMLCSRDLTVAPPTAQCVQNPDPSCAEAPHVFVTAQGGGCAAGGTTDSSSFVLLLGLGLLAWVARRSSRGGDR